MMRTRKWYAQGEPPKPLTCFTGAEEAAAIPAIAEAAGATTAGSAASAATLGEIFGPEAALSGASIGGGLTAAQMIPLGLQAGGAFMKYGAARDAAARQAKLAKAMGDYKLGNANQQTGVVKDYIAGDTPEARAASMQDATNDAKLGYDQSVGAAQAFTNPGDVSGKVSQQFRDAGQASADASMARTNKLIANLSAMRAPGLAQAQRSRDYSLAAGNVGALKSASNNVGDAFMTDIGGVQPSPWMNMAGDAAAGVGQGLAYSNANAKTLAALKKGLAA